MSDSHPDRALQHNVRVTVETTTNVSAGRDDALESQPREPADEFARQAEQAPPGLLAEFWDFLLHNKKWWLIPIILVLLSLIVLSFLGGSAAAPFIYPGI